MTTARSASESFVGVLSARQQPANLTWTWSAIVAVFRGQHVAASGGCIMKLGVLGGPMAAVVLVASLGLAGCASARDTSDVSTVVLHNNTPETLSVLHCAENCTNAADDGDVKPGATLETNISSDRRVLSMASCEGLPRNPWVACMSRTTGQVTALLMSISRPRSPLRRHTAYDLALPNVRICRWAGVTRVPPRSMAERLFWTLFAPSEPTHPDSNLVGVAMVGR